LNTCASACSFGSGAVAVADGRLDVDRRIAFGGVGQEVDDDVEQLRDARPGFRGCEHHRYQVALAQRALQRRVQLLRRHFALLEVGLHQLFIDFHNLVDQAPMRFLYRREVGLARRGEEAVGHLAVPARRQVERQAFLAEGLLDALEQVLEVDVVGVDLVDDDQAVQAAPGGPLHEAAGHHLDAVLRVDDDGRRFHRGERRQRVAEEIGIAGRVEQVDAGRVRGACRFEACDRKLEGVLQLLLERGVVAHGGAALDAARGGDRPRC
jgi:hypothetical protein